MISRTPWSSLPAVLVTAVMLSGCAPVRPPASQGVPAATPPAATAAVDPGQEQFESQVLPILQGRCNPCHFPGGKMYDRLPFDRPGTIRVLGTALFTRIHDEEEREVIRAFLGVPPESLPEPP